MTEDKRRNEKQLRLLPKRQIQPTYTGPQRNEVIDGVQIFETSRGCARNCPWCYEPTEKTFFDVPEIISNNVQITDMNFLERPDAHEIIKDLGNERVKGNVVHYEMTSGFDYRLLTQEIADDLKRSRFIKPRIAWDWEFGKQLEIKDAIWKLLKAGYKRKEIGVFMIVNHIIPKDHCDRKLDLLKVWNVHACDCCFDGGYKYAVPEFWTKEEIVEFRGKCRKHNQIVNFGVDPEWKK